MGWLKLNGQYIEAAGDTPGVAPRRTYLLPSEISLSPLSLKQTGAGTKGCGSAMTGSVLDLVRASHPKAVYEVKASRRCEAN